MRIVLPWLSELVAVPGEPERIASEIALRGFEVASVEDGPIPVIDFEVTANRPDCMNHLGIAREASVIWNLPVTPPAVATLDTIGSQSDVSVSIEDPELCPRYCAQVFDIRVGPSPRWLAERLEAAGVRPINNIVDITNYVMLEFGQPMHAFDLDRLAGRRLIVRRAREEETLKTLDGIERELDEEMLVIADADHATAIGGVMGGRSSEIGPGTTRMALESAYFQPASVRRTSKRLGLKTEASIRFERGGDVAAPPVGIARAAALFEKIEAGRAVGALVDRYASPRPAVGVALRAERIKRLLGQHVPPADVPRILEPLGFRVAAETSGRSERWEVTVPSFRVDVTRRGRPRGRDWPALRVRPAAGHVPSRWRPRNLRRIRPLLAPGRSARCSPRLDSPRR